MKLATLRRVRWAVRGVLALGVAASVTANILHANDNPISQTIAAWPPLALLLTVELISRVPVHRRSLAVARVFATVAIAGIAAWVSYWHMAGVVARYGETGATPYLMPFSVDGLVIVASVCLVELAGRIRAATEPTTDAISATATAKPAAIQVPATLTATGTPADATASAPAVNSTGTATITATTKPTRQQVARRPASADKVARAAARMPGATVAAIAAKAGVSESTARRYLPTPTTASTPTDPPATAATVASATPARPAETPHPTDHHTDKTDHSIDSPTPLAA
jgi:hypothetical protein